MRKPEELIILCKRGDPAAYKELYNAHAGAVYNTIVRLVRDTAQAEDILQDSFVSAFQSIDRFTPGDGFRAWVKRIAINKSIDWIRKQKINYVEWGPQLDELLAEEVLEEEAAFPFTMDDVVAALEFLPDSYRTVFSLYAMENIPQAEIAKMLGLEHATVRTQYHRAKQKILVILMQKRLV